MNLYIAKINFNIKIDVANSSNQFDEQLRFIYATSENEAFLKARMLGVREDDSFVNNEGNIVKWEFTDVLELKLVEEIKDGMEIFSCISERDDAESFVRYIQQKAKQIESNTEPHLVSYR